MAAAGDSMRLDYLLCDCMLAVDSLRIRDREMELVDLRMAFHLRNSCLMMSHDCSYTQTAAAICSCCLRNF